jgi:hypothetical protein
MGAKRRSSVISVTYGLVGGLFWISLVGVVLVAAGILAPHREFLIDALFRAPRAARHTFPLDVLPGPVSVEVLIHHASTGQRFLEAVAKLSGSVSVLPLLWFVRRILGSVRSEDPFNRSNVQSIRAISAILLLGLPLADAMSTLATRVLVHGVHGATARFDVGGDIENVLIGLIVFVLAEVFAYGIRLREDVEGTV